jgi:flagellin-like hook-associated protein FlgL
MLDGADRVVLNTSERLASGQRINRASDDAAGLSIVTKLQADRRVYAQGIRNVNDGISLLQIADSAFANLADIDTRIAELANQAANGVYSNAQRTPLHNEAVALRAEYQRILDSTTFNGRNVFEGLSEGILIQGGYGTVEATKIQLGSQGTLTSDTTVTVGTGSFGATATTTGGSQGGYNLHSLAPFDKAQTMASGDLNGDGRDELVAALRDADGGGDHVYVLGFNSSGVQISDQGLIGADTATGLTLGDVDGDSDLDILHGAGFDNSFWTYRNNGDGSFAAPTSTSTATGSSGAITTGFFNADSHLDVAVALNTNRVRIYTGNGDGTFAAGFSINVSAVAENILTGDFTGDTVTDLAITANGALRLFAGNGNGTFGAGVTLYSGLGTDKVDVSAAQIDGNSSLDIVVGDLNSNKIVILLNNGTGSFSAATTVNIADLYNLTGVSDQNSDGNLDFVVNTGTIVATYRGNGDGTFQAAISSAGTSVVDESILGDFNGDGVADFVAGTNSNVQLEYKIATSTSETVTTSSSSAVPAVTTPTVDLRTRADALTTLDAAKANLESVAVARGTIGATMVRLEAKRSKLEVTVETFGQAASQILDADVAIETSNLVAANIRREISARILSLTTVESELALRLLQ